MPLLSASCTALPYTSKHPKFSVHQARSPVRRRIIFSESKWGVEGTLGFAVSLQERGIPAIQHLPSAHKPNIKAPQLHIVTAVLIVRFPPMSSKPIQNSFPNILVSLLLAIFEAVCNYEPVQLPLSPAHPRHVLNLVCKQWYNVIRSTFSLWNNIQFTKPGNGVAHERHPLLKQLAFCARLSGLQPLTIKFNPVFDVDDAWSFSVVRAVIIPYAHRIKSLSCFVSGHKDACTFLTSSGGGSKFLMLESVDISFMNTKDTPITSFPLKDWVQFTGFRDAPRLHKATFRLANGLHPLDLHLPWGQLTSLDMGVMPMTPEVFIKILHMTASCLEKGFFCVRFSKPYHPSLILSRRVVSMRTLQTLRLLLFFPSQDTRLFSLLQFPALQGLWVQMHDLYQDWDIALYTKLLRGSTKTLRHLRLQDYPPHGAEYGDSSFVAKRWHLAKAQHARDLEALFTAVPRVDKLHLPPGVYLPAATAARMGAYALLPELFFLEASALDARPILAMARRRHALFLEAGGSDEEAVCEAGSSQQPMRSLCPLTTIELLVPRNLPTDEKAAVVAEAQALGLFGIVCTIQSTDMLPPPVVDPREVMRSRLLAWVKGVPDEYLKI